jgi:hypothetical protein
MSVALQDTSGHPKGSPGWLPVQTLGEIEFLIKESEVLTGHPGRQFVVASADRLAYQVYWHPLGFKVERMDSANHVLDTCHLLLREFSRHGLADALANGQLFTVNVPRANLGGD